MEIEMGDDAAKADPELWLIGGIHDALGHYERARAFIVGKAGEYGSPPAFIAAEWDKGWALSMLGVRDYLANRMAVAWPNAHPEVRGMALESLCWEATVASGLFAEDPEIVWLDDGLRPEYAALAKDPKASIENYKAPSLATYVGDADKTRSVSEALDANEAEFAKWKECWEKAAKDRKNRETREPTWADRIAETVARHRGATWGVACIGSAHATRLDEFSLPNQLDERDIKFERYFLYEPPWFARTG